MWKLDPSKNSALLAAKLNVVWDRRCAEAEAYNARLERGEIGPGVVRRVKWVFGRGEEREWREGKVGRREASLVMTCNEVFMRWFWVGGIYKGESVFEVFWVDRGKEREGERNDASREPTS